MVFDKQSVIDHISQVAGPSVAAQAKQALPDQVDTDLHGDLLKNLGVDLERMVGQLGGMFGGGGNRQH